MVKRALRYLPALSVVGFVVAGLRQRRNAKATAHRAQGLRADVLRREAMKRFRRGPAVSRHMRFERRTPRHRVPVRH